MGKQESTDDVADRKLGDEWLDWDGRLELRSPETDYRLFLGLAVLAATALAVVTGFFLWLIYPRLAEAGSFLPRLFSIIFLVFTGALMLWTVLFTWSAAVRRPLTRKIANPRLINKLLSIVTGLGRIFGISPDRLTNSFLKIHNVIVGSKPVRVEPDRLLILAPRCLTRDNLQRLRSFRDRYGFQMATVGGGSQARTKIREVSPHMVIAIACERDLLSGFKEVNPNIPVIGFPNQRPEGPCKNTCIDINLIEDTVRRCLRSESDESA